MGVNIRIGVPLRLEECHPLALCPDATRRNLRYMRVSQIAAAAAPIKTPTPTVSHLCCRLARGENPATRPLPPNFGRSHTDKPAVTKNRLVIDWISRREIGPKEKTRTPQPIIVTRADDSSPRRVPVRRRDAHSVREFPPQKRVAIAPFPDILRHRGIIGFPCLLGPGFGFGFRYRYGDV